MPMLMLLAMGLPNGALHAAAQCGPPTGKISAGDLPQQVRLSECPIVGRTVTDQSLELDVPPPGTEVGTEEIYDGRDADTFVIETTAAGVVNFYFEGEDDQQTGGSGGSGPPACEDNAYNLEGHEERDLFEWGFNESTTPTELTQSQALTAIRDAIVNITHEHDNCNLTPADAVSATSNYLPGLSDPTNINNDGTCPGQDSNNVVGFGDLPSDLVGKACWRSFPQPGINDLMNADVRLNKADKNFTTTPSSGCNASTPTFDVEAVMTHEWGHVFGLAHVSESGHQHMTMSPIVGRCDGSQRSLGWGDVRGLRELY